MDAANAFNGASRGLGDVFLQLERQKLINAQIGEQRRLQQAQIENLGAETGYRNALAGAVTGKEGREKEELTLAREVGRLMANSVFRKETPVGPMSPEQEQRMGVISPLAALMALDPTSRRMLWEPVRVGQNDVAMNPVTGQKFTGPVVLGPRSMYQAEGEEAVMNPQYGSQAGAGTPQDNALDILKAAGALFGHANPIVEAAAKVDPTGEPSPLLGSPTYQTATNIVGRLEPILLEALKALGATNAPAMQPGTNMAPAGGKYKITVLPQ